MSDTATSDLHLFLYGKWQCQRNKDMTHDIFINFEFSLHWSEAVCLKDFNKAYFHFMSSTAGLLNSWVAVLAFLLIFFIRDSRGQRHFVCSCQSVCLSVCLLSKIVYLSYLLRIFFSILAHFANLNSNLKWFWSVKGQGYSDLTFVPLSWVYYLTYDWREFFYFLHTYPLWFKDERTRGQRLAYCCNSRIHMLIMTK